MAEEVLQSPSLLPLYLWDPPQGLEDAYPHYKAVWQKLYCAMNYCQRQTDWNVWLLATLLPRLPALYSWDEAQPSPTDG